MFKTCEHCGANLDPGEVCDCDIIYEETKKKYMNLIDSNHYQTQIRFEEKEGMNYECTR